MNLFLFFTSIFETSKAPITFWIGPWIFVFQCNEEFVTWLSVSAISYTSKYVGRRRQRERDVEEEEGKERERSNKDHTEKNSD